MALNFANGSNTTIISRPPRVVHTTDGVAGCPPTRSSAICTTTIVTTSTAWIYLQARIIRNISGRSDLYLYATGPNGWSNSSLRVRLNWTNATAWDHVNMRFNYYLNTPGTYTFWLNGAANTWGCGNDWGSMSILIMEV